MDTRRKTGFWWPAGLWAAAFLLVPACWGAPAELRVCDDIAEPISLNPLKEFSEKHFTITQHIFDSLVRFDPKGRLASGLAESWRWTDERTLELKLRRGVRFHDGEAFDAESVRYSLARFTDPAGGFPGAGFLSSIAEVEAVDPATVRIKTRYPDGVLLHRLAGFAPIIPKGYITSRGDAYFESHPVGTGPFRFVEWDHSGRKLVLEANRSYWQQGLLRFDRLVFMFIPADEQVDKLLKGDVDVVTELPGTDTLRVMRSGVARIIKKESFYTAASSLNCRSGPLSDRRVRQALNYALNKGDLVRYDLLGNGRAIATLTMPGEFGHDPALRPYPYDPAKARKLLKEAGYAAGFHLKALVKVQGVRTMRIIAKQLSRIGIIVDIDLTTDTAAVRDMTKKPWDWIYAGCPDPIGHAFFNNFIFLSSLSPFSITKDSEFDRLLDKMVGTIDAVEQDKAGRALDRYVYDHALSLFTYQRIKTYGVRNGIHFVPSVTGLPNFALSRPEAHAATAR